MPLMRRKRLEFLPFVFFLVKRTLKRRKKLKKAKYTKVFCWVSYFINNVDITNDHNNKW